MVDKWWIYRCFMMFMIWNRYVFPFRIFRLHRTGLGTLDIEYVWSADHWVWKVWYLLRSGAPIFWSMRIYYNPLSSNGIGVVTVVWWALFPVVWYPICCTRITEATRLRYFSTERRLDGDGPFHPWNISCHPWNISWGMCNPMYRTG